MLVYDTQHSQKWVKQSFTVDIPGWLVGQKTINTYNDGNLYFTSENHI